MKYDTQLTEVKTQLAQARNILIALPAQLTVDKLASGLSLMLALKASGKQVNIVTEGTPLVAHSNLFGVGEIKNILPQESTGDYVITLEGVVEANGQIPSLEKLDWYPQGANLNLVFHVLPGQKFEPKNIHSIPAHAGSNYDLIFVIGSTSLGDLGGVYSQNSQVFTNGYSINIDNSSTNTSFGKTNVIDPNAASISEMMVSIFQSFSLGMDSDIASNIVAGIYDVTSNLTVNAKPDSFMALASAMQAGAKLPGGVVVQPQTVTPQTLTPPQSEPQPNIASEPMVSSSGVGNQGFDLSKVFGMTPNTNPPAQDLSPRQDTFVSPPVIGGGEEKPTGEFATNTPSESEGTPAPDWLTPKIFKGGSLG